MSVLQLLLLLLLFRTSSRSNSESAVGLAQNVQVMFDDSEVDAEELKETEHDKEKRRKQNWT